MNARFLHALCSTLLSIVALSTGIVGFAQTSSPTVERRGSNQVHQQFVRGRILVKFKEGVSEERIRGLLAERGARSTRVIEQIGVHIVELPSGADEEAAVDAFRELDEVEFAEVDRILRLTPSHAIEEVSTDSQDGISSAAHIALAQQSIAPNDYYYFIGYQWGLQKISAPEAWSITTGSSSIVIAVIDTGVDPTQPDLQGKLTPGWNVADNDSNTTDVESNGTSIAGIVGALTNNSLGVAGLCWNCMIMPVRVVATDGSVTYSNVAIGITWAADHGARVANTSFMCDSSAAVSSAAQYLQNKGGILTVPAGDYGSVDTNPINPYMITVAATDQNDTMYSWSNSGSDIVLVAPGTTESTEPFQMFGSVSGTSIAAPFVAGTAALMLSVNPNLTGTQITSMLEQTADHLGTQGWNSTYGYGRVNAMAAVQAAAGQTNTGAGSKSNTTTAINSNLNPSTLGQLVTFTASVTPRTATGTITFLDGTTTLGTAPLSTGIATLSIAALTQGTHSVAASYSGDSGNNSSASGAISQVVMLNKANTTTSVASTPNPSASGQSVTFAATVSPSSATGTITFWDGGSTLGTSAIVSGKATFSTVSLAAGSHSITASYGGDSNYNGDVSGMITQTVDAVKNNTTSTVVSSINPASVGQSVTLTAKVSPAAATGTITFLDGTSILGVVTINGGVATLSTSSLAAGAHSVTAIYSGDSNNNSNTSPSLTQTVNAAPAQPTAPVLVSAIAKSATEVDLSWTSSSDALGIAGYQITRNSIAVATVSGSTLNYADTSVSPNTTYAYVVKGYDKGGSFSNASNSIQVATSQASTSTGCPSPASGAFSGCYFNNITLSGAPTFIRTDNQINFYWGNGSPDKSLTPDNFSVRWQGNFTFAAGTYKFSAVTSDGMRVYIDGNLMLNMWRNQPPYWYTFSTALSQGTHLVVVEYYEQTNGATASLSWQQN